jgi:DNA polymerase-1
MSMSAKPPAKDPNHPHHIYLIDGSGYIFRAYFALPPMTRPDGTPVNAVFGFVNMLIKLLADTEAEGIAVVFDSARENFRNRIYPAYKAQRPDVPEELIPQFQLIRDATRAFNLPCIEMPDYEADDLIATYARQAREAGLEVTVVSSDKDLMQLVREGVAMLDPVKNRSIGPKEVVEKFGLGPDKVVDIQSLAGDSTDNVPGVPGIGIKTAAQLIEEYGDLETLLSRASEIKQPKRRENLIQFAEQARISKQLVQLKDDVPLTVGLEDLHVREPDPAALRAFLEENGFRSVIARLGELLDDGAETPAEALAPESAGEYELVQDMNALKRWIAGAIEEGTVAVDTETTSLDALRADLVGVSLALAGGKACYIPLGHTGAAAGGELDLANDAKAPKQIPIKQALAALKPLFEDPGVLKVGQNLKYDMLVLGQHGIELSPIDDTMLLSYVLDGGLHGHGMDELARLHLGHETIKFKDVAGSGKSQVTFDKVPLDKARDYAAEDADITLKLHGALKPRLVPERMATVYETLERALVPVLTQMERDGIKVDRDTLRTLSNDFAQRTAELEKQIHKLAGREFTIGSPKQLGEILFDEMGLSLGNNTRKGKSGAYTTDASVLEALANQGHDLPARVLDWRQLTKLKSTYTDALQEQIDPKTGRVHTSFSQAVASTGRLSSNDPNLQNIPIRTEEGRKIRYAFVAEKGHVLLSVDYSQIELRLAAHIAKVEPLRQAFLEGQDIHAATASQVFGVPIKGMDPMVRRKAKAINFGILYGISAFGLANNLGIPQGEAKAYIEAYFKRYPGIRDYMEKTKAFCREHGFVDTLFGRKIHMPGIKDKNPARRNFAERAAINAPIQGSAADIIKRAMIRVPPALEKAKLKARMLLQVHDELLFEVPKAEIDKTAEVVKAVMENACAPVLELSVPLVADIGTGPNWAEAH